MLARSLGLGVEGGVSALGSVDDLDLGGLAGVGQGSVDLSVHKSFIGAELDPEDGAANFNVAYGMVSLNDPDQWKKNFHNCLSVTYFSLTTLSTIGFGDFNPKSNVERFIIAFVLLFRVMVFSLIMGIFMEIVDRL
jgi:hypothetical protein